MRQPPSGPLAARRRLLMGPVDLPSQVGVAKLVLMSLGVDLHERAGASWSAHGVAPLLATIVAVTRAAQPARVLPGCATKKPAAPEQAAGRLANSLAAVRLVLLTAPSASTPTSFEPGSP